jgi:hypothetical protein
MDFCTYENSKLIPDQSAWQIVAFWISNEKIDVYQFLNSKNIQISTTASAAAELCYQTCKPNLFGTSITSSELSCKQNFVLSSANGSLTSPDLDRGLPAKVEEPMSCPKEQQRPLWDSMSSFRRMERNKRGRADVSNIYHCRRLFGMKERFFLFTNDKDQIKQSVIEGFRTMRPQSLLVWMVKEKYITRQKAVWAYEKTTKRDPRWTITGLKFRNLINI